MKFETICNKRNIHPEQFNLDMVTLSVLSAGPIMIYEVQHHEHLGHTYEVHNVGIYSTSESANIDFDAICIKTGCTMTPTEQLVNFGY